MSLAFGIEGAVHWDLRHLSSRSEGRRSGTLYHVDLVALPVVTYWQQDNRG